MDKQMMVDDSTVSLNKGYAIDQQVDLVFDAANGLLLMRTGTAKSIREASEELDDEGRKKYYELLNQFSALVMQKYIRTFGVEDWEPRQAQLSCFRKIVENGGPFEVGAIVLDREWSMQSAKDVLHVVCRTYYMSGEDLEMTRVEEHALGAVLQQAFAYADENSYRSVAVPVLCTGGRHGLSARDSLQVILDAIKETELSSLQEIIICFESTKAQALYDRLDEEALEGF